MFILLIIIFLSCALVEIIKSKWAKECGYNCNKCKVWDCPGKQCIKKSKYMILFIAAAIIFSSVNVHAAVNSFSATINGYNLAIGNYWYFQVGNQNIIIDVNGYPDGLENPSDYWYSSLVLCESSPTSPSAIYAQGTNATAIKDLRAIRTNYRCFTDENGNTGKVTAILYQQTGGGSYNKQNFVYYMNTGIVTLLDYNVSLNGYYDLSKFSNINSIIDQRTIVDQNNTIINGQEDIKNNTDEINNSITSDDSDVTSSKCGIICKLKGIINVIANLPSKFGDLLKSLFIPTDEQMSDLLNDTQTKLNSKLGILGLPTTLYTQFLNLLTSDVNENSCIEFEDIKDPVYDQVLITSSSYCFSSLLENERLNSFRTACMLIVGGLIILAFCSYLKKSYNRIMDIADFDENYEYITSEDSYNIDYSTGEVKSMRHNERRTRREKV